MIKITFGCIKLFKNYIQENMLALIAVGVVGTFLTYLFGLSGFRFAVAFFIVFYIPFFLLLEHFGLSKLDASIFALFFGLLIMPCVVFYLGFVFPFSIAIFVTVLLLVGLYFGIRKLKPKKEHH